MSSELATGDNSPSLYATLSNAISTPSSGAHMVAVFDPSNTDDQFHAVLLAAPFIFYTILWLFPSVWVKLCGDKNPSEQMSFVAHFLKLVQAYALYDLCKDHYLSPSTYVDELGQTTVVICAFLLALGQYLNISVYNSLGTEGVYYGVRYGIHVPWCDDFPYNVSWLKNPQYIGAIMTEIALIPLIQLPLSWGLFCVVCYVYLCFVESSEWTPRASWSKKRKSLMRNDTIAAWENPEDDDEDDDDLVARIANRRSPSPVKKQRSSSKGRAPPARKKSSPKKKASPVISKSAAKALKAFKKKKKKKVVAPPPSPPSSDSSESEEEEEEYVAVVPKKRASSKKGRGSTRTKSKGRSSSNSNSSTLEARIEARRSSPAHASPVVLSKSAKKALAARAARKSASPKKRSASKGRATRSTRSRKMTPVDMKKLPLEERIKLRMSGGK